MTITLQKTVLLALSLSLATNAVWMLAAPEHWYHTLPGVSHTGPLNLHFVRDIGAAYLAAAVGFAHALIPNRGQFSYLLPGSIFLLGHAAIHALETSHDHNSQGVDVPVWGGVYLPALVSLILLYFAGSPRQRQGE